MSSAAPSGQAERAAPAPANSPEARLVASRLAMRAAMLPVAAAPGAAPSGLRAKLGRHLPSSVEGVLSHPAAELLKDTVRTWWATRPWRPFIAVGGVAAKQMIVPLARQHPARLIGGAMLAGAVLSRWRPWKWVLASVGPAVVASMLPTLVTRLASRLPLAALLKVVGVGAPAPSVSKQTVVRSDPLGATPLPTQPEAARS